MAVHMYNVLERLNGNWLQSSVEQKCLTFTFDVRLKRSAVRPVALFRTRADRVEKKAPWGIISHTTCRWSISSQCVQVAHIVTERVLRSAVSHATAIARLFMNNAYGSTLVTRLIRVRSNDHDFYRFHFQSSSDQSECAVSRQRFGKMTFDGANKSIEDRISNVIENWFGIRDLEHDDCSDKNAKHSFSCSPILSHQIVYKTIVSVRSS